MPKPFARALFLASSLLLMVGGAQAEELRDPFTFGPRTSATSQSRPMLIGILWDATHPLAIVGEQTVAVGEMLESWQIIAIEPDGIRLQRGQQQQVVTTGHPLPE